MTNLVTVTELVTKKIAIKQWKKVFLWSNQLTTKTAGDRIKTAIKKHEENTISFDCLDGHRFWRKGAKLRSRR